MDHKEKQDIFDTYFASIKRVNIDCFLASFGVHEHLRSNLINHIFAACDLVQKEQQKRIADNAKMTVKTEHGKSEAVAFSSGDRSAWINKESITNPENLIK